VIPAEIIQETEALHSELGEARRIAQRMQERWPAGDQIRVRLSGEATAYAVAQERIGELLKLMREHDTTTNLEEAEDGHQHTND
jgi:hypothetical protein